MTKKTKNYSEALEAVNYFYANGFIEELTRDKKYFVEALIKYFAEKENIELL